MSQSLQMKPRAHVSETLKALSKVPVNEDGRISWGGTQLDEGTFALVAGLEFPSSIGDHIKDAAIWHVLNECARKTDFSQKFFLRGLQEFIKEHLSKSPKTLVGISQVNCNYNVNLPKRLLSIEGPIEFRMSLSGPDRSVLSKLGGYEIDRLGLQSDFLYVTTRVKAPDDRSALDMAYRNIKYSLGVMNLICRGFGISMRFGIPHAPIGGLLTASPIFMINRGKRELGSHITENHFPIAFKTSFTFRQQLDSERAAKAFRPYISDLRGIDFREKIIQAIVLFQEAL